jgi:hypothetical protein
VERDTFNWLVEIMTRMAAGDRAAVFTLYGDFGLHLAAQLRRELARMGVEHVDPAELDGLVIDGCLSLFDCAASWDAGGGALPWTWAARRLAHLAARWVGQHADRFDPARHDGSAESHAVERDGEELEVLGRLAGCHDRCALVEEALARVATARDRAILLELRVQEVEGDPSPANTVAARHGLKPEAVRQVTCRVRARLRRLASAEARYAAIACIPLVA